MFDAVPRLPALLREHLLPDDEVGEASAATLVRRAAAHGVVAWTHDLALAEGWPNPLIDPLAQARRAMARHALHLAHTLRALTLACDTSGVPMLTMKGVALSTALHGDMARRGTRDLDVLVPPAALGVVAGLLQDMAFTPDAPWRGWTYDDFASKAHTYHEFAFHGPAGVTVEVHTHLTARFISATVPFDELWARRQPVRVAGTEVGMMSWSDTWLHLATHGFRHAWERLVWVSDIAHLMARPDVDWADVQNLARRRRGRVAVEAAALVAHDLLGAPLPETGPAWPSRRARHAAAAVTTRVRNGRLHPSGTTMLRDHWRSRDSTLEAMGYLWRVATTMTPADCVAPETWPPTATTRWVRRPVRLVRRYVLRAG